jgi:hypothetical protein
VNRQERRARERRERSQRLKLNRPSGFGGVNPVKQHGRVLMLVNAESGIVERELSRDTFQTTDAASRRIWPDVEHFVTTVGVAPDYGIITWATGVPAQLAPEGGYGPLVLVEGWCEHIRDEAADTLGFLDPDVYAGAVELAQAFAASPDGWLVMGHMPAAPLLGG